MVCIRALMSLEMDATPGHGVRCATTFSPPRRMEKIFKQPLSRWRDELLGGYTLPNPQHLPALLRYLPKK